MASIETKKYADTIMPVTVKYADHEACEYTEEQLQEAFDAGVASVNKRINEVNGYYNQLKGMSEDYQAGYLQAEKDMPTPSEAAFEIIRLQKKLDALNEHNKWHRVDENPDDLPTEDKEYLVKVVFNVGTGNEHVFLAQWWNENKFWDSLYEKDIVAWKEVE